MSACLPDFCCSIIKKETVRNLIQTKICRHIYMKKIIALVDTILKNEIKKQLDMINDSLKTILRKVLIF